MTPAQAFKIGGRNPNSGLCVREWYGFTSQFFRQPVMHEGRIIIGLRHIAATDMASHYVMAFDAAPESASTLMAVRIIPFISRVCEKYGKPSKGIVVSHSCWLSSLELLLDEDTKSEGEFLKSADIQFGPMPDGDKAEIEKWGNQNGVRVIFDADQIGDNA